jgi:hypothetical protein
MPLKDAGLVLAAKAIAAGATTPPTPAPPSFTPPQPTGSRSPGLAEADGGMTLSVAENYTGGAPSGPATHVGLWSPLTAGSLYDGFAITTGDVAFNAAGEYILEDITLDGSSTG